MTRSSRIAIALLLASGLVLLALRLSGGGAAPTPVAPAGEAPGPTSPTAEVGVPASETTQTTVRESVMPATAEGAPPRAVALDGSITGRTATLKVKAQRKDTGSPLAGIEVIVEANRWELDEPPEWTRVNSQKTDASGLAALEVPAGARLFVGAPSQLVDRPAGEPLMTGDTWADYLVLASGVEREITLEVPVGFDLTLWIRVAGEGGHPVPGTELWWQSGLGCHLDLHDLESDAVRSGESDGDGLVRLSLHSWVDNCLFAVAPGLVPVQVPVEAGHEDPDRALEITLPRGARLTVSAVGPAEIIEILGIRVMALDPTEEEYLGGSLGWAGAFDDQGHCTFSGLPVGVTLSVSLNDDEGTYRRCEQDIELHVGEDRILQWVVGDGASIRGRLFDQHDQLIAGCTVRLMDGGTTDRSSRGSLRAFPDRPLRGLHAKTDASGRFSFEDLAPGTYWLGPRPEDEDTWVEGGIGRWWSKEIACVARQVEVHEKTDVVDIDLQTHRGVFIRGHVIGPDETAVEDAWIQATCANPPLLFEGETGAGGRFELGPLNPGEYTLRAWSSWLAGGEELEASSGDGDVVIELRRPGELKGRVVDPITGEGLECSVLLSVAGALETITLSYTHSEGHFIESTLIPGVYDAVATTHDGRTGTVRSIEIVAGESRSGVLIEVHPAASISITLGDDYSDCYTIHRAGVLVGYGGESGEDAAVPAGELVVELWRFDELVEQRAVTLAPGEKKEMRFE